MLKLNPETARAIGLNFGGDYLTLHLPISAKAVQELKSPNPHKETDSALAGFTVRDFADLAFSGEPVRITPLDRLALGL